MEIGSIFEIDLRELFNKSRGEETCLPFMKSGEWNYSLFNTGRSVIEVLLRQLSMEKGRSIDLWLPAFCCSSIYEAANRAGVDIYFYPIEKDMSLLEQTLKNLTLTANSVFYCIQFFGVPLSPNIIEIFQQWKKNGIVIIEDITLAALSSQSFRFGFGDYILASLRKWVEIPDGAILVTKEKMSKFDKGSAANDYSLYYFVAQLMKTCYLKDKSLNKQDFLDFSKRGMESLFSDYEIREMSLISQRLFPNIDIERVVNIRKKNYSILYEKLQEISGIKAFVEPTDDLVPLGMVIACEHRDSLINYLISHDIYCNIHWRQNQATERFEETSWLAEHCITIPCDQRYNEEHMQYIVDVLKDWEKINYV